MLQTLHKERENKDSGSLNIKRSWLYQLDHKQQCRIKSDLRNLDFVYIFLQR